MGLLLQIENPFLTAAASQQGWCQLAALEFQGLIGQALLQLAEVGCVYVTAASRVQLGAELLLLRKAAQQGHVLAWPHQRVTPHAVMYASFLAMQGQKAELGHCNAAEIGIEKQVVTVELSSAASGWQRDLE